jgi:D-alanyl-D-alanine carboxypeptidase
MSGTREANWLAQNAWRHGLILRYPQGREDVTQVAYEPWHFRYVGIVHAWYMTYHGLVLEEYLKRLEDSGGYSTVINGITYHVMYQRPRTDNPMLDLPDGMVFQASGDNRGGYIITVNYESAP